MFKRILTYSILGLVALGGFFGNIHIETRQSDNNIVTISYEGSTTYAASGDTTSSESVKMYNGMIDKINIVLAVLSAMISPIILFVGWLMSPDWTSGDLFNLRPKMHLLWVTVSNIVYFVYAVLLILIALGTMFNNDKFSYKVMLPKLALGIIMVPFTWMFVQATISLANVATASVMTIPSNTIGQNDSKWFTDKSIPKFITIDSTGTGTDTEKSKCPDKCISPKDFLAKSGGMYGPLIVYGYSIFKFQEIDHLNSGLDIASAALQIVHTSILSAIMFGVFGILIVALAVILLVRAIKLWVYAIFSPLFTFRFVAGSNIMGSGEDTFTVKEFVGLAFLPAIIGLTLSFGLIMINAVQGPGASSGGTPPATCDLAGAGCEIKNVMGSADNSILRKIYVDDTTGNKSTLTMFKYSEITFSFLGKAVNQTNTKSTANGTLDALGGMFGTLIVDVIALVFIWISFMAAKNVSKAVGAVAQPFEEMGKKIGSLAMSMPKYAPLPIPGGSVSGLKHTVDLSQQKFESQMREKQEENIGRFAPGLVQGVIKEQDRIKARIDLDKDGKRNDYSQIQSTLGTVASDAKSTQTNIESLQKIIEEAHTDRNQFKKNISLDTSLNEDTRKAATKFAGKETLDSKETELVMKWLKSKGTGSDNTKTSTYASSEVIVNGPNKRLSINIEGVQVQLDATGKNMETISGENLTKIQNKVKEMTESQFKEKLSGLNSEVKTAILNKIKENNFDFKKPS